MRNFEGKPVQKIGKYIRIFLLENPYNRNSVQTGNIKKAKSTISHLAFGVFNCILFILFTFLLANYDK